MSQPMLTELSVNYSEGSEENRVLMTGLHSVRDVFCIGCEDVLGWKYVSPVLASLSKIPCRWLHLKILKSTKKERLSWNGLL